MPRAGRSDDAREWVARAFTRAEDVVYRGGVGVLLASSALAGRVVELLDQILLVFMIVEILHTCRSRFASMP